MASDPRGDLAGTRTTGIGRPDGEFVGEGGARSRKTRPTDAVSPVPIGARGLSQRNGGRKTERRRTTLVKSRCGRPAHFIYGPFRGLASAGLAFARPGCSTAAKRCPIVRP